MYLPAVNIAMFAAVLLLMLTFGSSERLATAYGVSVTGALLIDTILLLNVAKALWAWPTWKLVAAAAAFGGAELAFLSANLTKVAHGGWLPLLIAAIMFTLMTTWQRGRQIVLKNRTAVEGLLGDFIEDLHTNPISRVPGTAVFPHPAKTTTPLALRANVEHNHVLHEHVVIVSAHAQNVPHIAVADQLSVDDLGYDNDGIVHLTVRYGFADSPDIPQALRIARSTGHQEVDVDPDTASYFVSRATLHPIDAAGMRRRRKRLFVTLAHNATNPVDYFGLPCSAPSS